MVFGYVLRGNVNSSPNRSQIATNFKNIRNFTLMFFVRNVKNLSAQKKFAKAHKSKASRSTYWGKSRRQGGHSEHEY